MANQIPIAQQWKTHRHTSTTANRIIWISLSFFKLLNSYCWATNASPFLLYPFASFSFLWLKLHWIVVIATHIMRKFNIIVWIEADENSMNRPVFLGNSHGTTWTAGYTAPEVRICHCQFNKAAINDLITWQLTEEKWTYLQLDAVRRCWGELNESQTKRCSLIGLCYILDRIRNCTFPSTWLQ